MKANYKNWMPKGMIKGALISTVVLCALTCLVGIGTIVGKILLALTILSAFMTIWMFLMYRAFSYNGKRQMSKQIIEGVSSYVVIPDGGVGLDVGCGSAALTIACAKKNPSAKMIGIDDVALSMPAIVGRSGVEGAVPIRLSDEEKKALKASADTLKEVLSGVL